MDGQEPQGPSLGDSDIDAPPQIGIAERQSREVGVAGPNDALADGETDGLVLDVAAREPAAFRTAFARRAGRHDDIIFRRIENAFRRRPVLDLL
ncbi:hypothetical protein D3C80_1931140 [compost metagenome]